MPFRFPRPPRLPGMPAPPLPPGIFRPEQQTPQNRTDPFAGLPAAVDAAGEAQRRARERLEEPGVDAPTGDTPRVYNPTNTTQPGGDPNQSPPSVNQPASGGRRGWNNLNLDAPQNRGNYGRLEGFNTERAFAGGDPNSVKDGFARWITGLGFDPTTASKDEIEAFIRQNIPNARQYGLNILDVRGDQILIETRERGPEWVDVVRGAGGGDAAWQWLTQQEFGDTSSGGPDGRGGDAIAALRNMPGGSAILEALLAGDGLSGSDLFRRIQEELQKLLTGRPPSNPNAPLPGGGGGAPPPPPDPYMGGVI